MLLNSYDVAGNDISRGSFDIRSVRQTFAGAYEIMTSAAYARAEVLSAWGRYPLVRESIAEAGAEAAGFRRI